VLCHICCCCGVAAPCAAAIVTVGTNQKNFSEASLSWISTIWFILVSPLLLKSKFVCVFMYKFYLGWEFRKLVFFHMVPIISCEYKRDLKIQDNSSNSENFHCQPKIRAWSFDSDAWKLLVAKYKLQIAILIYLGQWLTDVVE